MHHLASFISPASNQLIILDVIEEDEIVVILAVVHKLEFFIDDGDLSYELFQLSNFILFLQIFQFDEILRWICLLWGDLLYFLF